MFWLLMHFAILILAMTVLTPVNGRLVLRTGEEIAVREVVSVERGQVLFRAPDGNLYMLRLDEVDVEATNGPGEPTAVAEEVEPVPEERETKRLAVSPEEKKRLLEEIEAKSGRGTAPPPPEEEEEAPDEAEPARTERSEEWWRERSQQYRSRVEQAERQLEAAIAREQQLNDALLFFAGSTGDATGYGYLVDELANVRDRIPRLREAVTKTREDQRAFENEARQQSILPGWLR